MNWPMSNLVHVRLLLDSPTHAPHAAQLRPFYNDPLPYAIMVVACPQRTAQILGMHPLLSNNQILVCNWYSLGWNQGMGCSAMPTEVIAHNSMHFDTLIKHSTVNSEKYAVVLS